jgi:hypothetical protein
MIIPNIFRCYSGGKYPVHSHRSQKYDLIDSNDPGASIFINISVFITVKNNCPKSYAGLDFFSNFAWEFY